MESLHNDLKKIQQLRVLSLNYGPDAIDKNVLQKALEEIQNKIISSKSLNYYIDIALKIEKMWKGHPIIETRKFDVAWGGFVEENLDDANIDRPSAVIFTGSPNEETDNRIREKLVDKIKLSEQEKMKVNVQSRTASGKIFFNTSEFEKDDWTERNLSLLLFQVKSENSSNLSNNPELFDTVDIGSLAPICWGLLVGDIDGFVLYSQKSERVHITIENTSKERPNRSNFLSLIIPNRLYQLSANQFFYNSVKYFEDIWSTIGYTEFSDWKNAWDH